MPDKCRGWARGRGGSVGAAMGGPRATGAIHRALHPLQGSSPAQIGGSPPVPDISAPARSISGLPNHHHPPTPSPRGAMFRCVLTLRM